MQDVDTTKYVIHANIYAEGVVEKSDVIGAIFGQTEGLLGDELDLRDLQRSGRIGRIEVNIESRGGKSSGTIQIPSSLDKVETAILAAALETIERVGPCIARIEVTRIEDVRETKRKKIVDRAKRLLREKFDEGVDSQELMEEVKQALRVEEVTYYKGLPAGPHIEDSDAIIIVEGRADVINLLKYGIKNVIAVEGTNIPPVISKLCKTKTATAFIDGDRGGELLLKELMQVADIDYVAVAPEGKSVEELTYKEVMKALRNKTPVEQLEYLRGRRLRLRRREEIEKYEGWAEELRGEVRAEAAPTAAERRLSLKEHMMELNGTFNARLLDKDGNIVREVAVRDLVEELKSADDAVKGVVFDGVVTQRIVDIATEKNLEYVVGAKLGSVVKVPVSLKVMTSADL
ncbi:MAG: DNA primase [Candidatus Alkanophagales archaeon MCA70_species_1]|nr:DNA primase [Candidatus Alkanophaga volatiphilum]